MQPTYTRTDLGKAGQAWPRFYVETFQDEGATRAEGRPIYAEREMVEIFLPGNTLSRPVEIVRDHHRAQWKEQYEAFKSGREATTDGWPLEQWPQLSPARVMELKAVGFRSIEDVAGMSEVAIQGLGMGARKLKELAAAFLDEAVHQQMLTQKSSQVEALQDQLAAAQNQIAEMGKLMQKMHADAMARTEAAAQTVAAPLVIPGMPEPAPIASRGQTFADLPEPKKRKRQE